MPQATEKLEIAVIGAGIAGLAAGIALRRAGHQVTIYERSTSKNEVGAAITMPPQASRILRKWGLEDAPYGDLASGKPVHGSRRRNSKTAEIVTRASFEDLEDVYGAPFVSYHRADLHSGLRQLAQDAGAEIVLGKVATSIDCATARVTFANSAHDLSNETVQKDLIVLADGVGAGFVKEITGQNNPARQSGRSAFRALIPTEKVLKDAEASQIFADGGENYWNSPATVDEALEIIHDFHPAYKAIARLAEPRIYTIRDREPLPTYVNGRAVVIGDAAHPMFPTIAGGGSTAIEDAAALEVILRDVKPSESTLITQRLALWNALRLPRDIVTQILSTAMVGPKPASQYADQVRHVYTGYLPDKVIAGWHDEAKRFICTYNVFDVTQKALEWAEREGYPDDMMLRLQSEGVSRDTTFIKMAQNLSGRLIQNIEATTTDPSTPLETRLFEEAELILPESLAANEKAYLVIRLSNLLQTIQQDPTPAVNLLLKLVQEYTYSDVLKLGSNIPFTSGLAVGEHMVSFNRLILALLHKATLNAADAASVASMLDTVLALVRLWLCTSDTGIASSASQLLLDLLRVDQSISKDPNEDLPSGGQGLMWKRVFGDRDVYRTIFEACSLTGKGPGDLKLSKSQRTLAQARLMEWLPRVGTMDWAVIERSHHVDVEKEFGVGEGAGLLEFAALRMVDVKDDVLMYRCLIDFFSELLQCSKSDVRIPGSAAQDSPALRYLITQGLHARTAAIYVQLPGVQLDPLESMFLYGPAANYIATYASIYPEHFLASQMPKQVLERLSTALNLSPGKWAHADSPKHDLHVLASLPRKALFTTSGTDNWRSSPLSLVPSKATNPDALNTLATIFHGPPDTITYNLATQQQDPATSEEPTYARALYYTYLSHNPTLWSDIITHADTIALKDLALSALNVLHSVITATWPPSQSTIPLPTALATPASGHLAILSPPSLEHTLPYLLKPPQTFANLVGGRGDVESAAYKIASAKFDALRAFHGRLQGEVERSSGEGYEEILATVGKRLAEGPLSREGEVGGRVGTLEL
ncbi:hypothetical protein PRZ48_015145 [Zasmidium cellare]|uniref:FAD-binding domain-containing protein n=1 Tax=Zasmidium cellare TaxID=395010 RepID=A0ABR0DXS5_ZASCE|nr:hypothetical protein PRZ48_015145 [Zasmidium cellare]